MENIKADFRRKQEIFRLDGASVSMLRIVMADGSSANIIYRWMRWCANHNLGLLAYFFQWLNKFMNGCVIGSGAEFGPGFVIMHPVGIVINSKVKGGSNITLESGVVIGDEKGKSPRLGSELFVGSGAKIIGDLDVADQVKVGANAVLTKSAEEGATMLGIPAKAYRRKSAEMEQ